MAWLLLIATSVAYVVFKALESKRSLAGDRTVSGDIPSAPATNIVREEEAQILELLSSTAEFVSLQGPAGIGKTALAARVANGVQRNPDWDVIAWIDASSHLRAEESMLRLGRALSVEASPDRRRHLEKVCDKLRSSRHLALLVVDGVVNFSDVRGVIPSGGNVRILATGLIASGLPMSQIIAVGPLPRQRAAQVLRDGGNGPMEGSLHLAAMLGGHALAITQAAAYLRTRKVSIPAYVQQLEDVHVPLSISFPVGAQGKDVVSAIRSGLNEVMETHLELGIHAIPRCVIDTLMVLGDCRISHELLAAVCGVLQEDVASCFKRLEKAGLMYSVMEDSSGASCLAWRSLVEIRGEFIREALNKIISAIEDIAEEASMRRLIPECVRLLHDLSLAKHLQKLGAWDGVASTSLLKAVDKLYSAGEFGSMLALSATLQTLNGNDFDYAKGQVIKRMAHAYLAAGNGAGAVSLYEKSVHILSLQNHLNPKEVTEAEIELGHALRSSGKFDRAVAVFEKVLDKLKDIDDPKLYIDAVAGLGFARLYGGDYEAACILMEQAWTARIQALGPNSFQTLAVQTNLGRAYLEAGEKDRALGLLKDAYRRRRKLLGVNNAHTLVTAFYLGRTWRALGRDAKGRKLIANVAAARADTLGPGHPDTIKAHSELLD